MPTSSLKPFGFIPTNLYCPSSPNSTQKFSKGNIHARTRCVPLQSGAGRAASMAAFFACEMPWWHQGLVLGFHGIRVWSHDKPRWRNAAAETDGSVWKRLKLGCAGLDCWLEEQIWQPPFLTRPPWSRSFESVCCLHRWTCGRRGRAISISIQVNLTGPALVYSGPVDGLGSSSRWVLARNNC